MLTSGAKSFCLEFDLSFIWKIFLLMKARKHDTRLLTCIGRDSSFLFPKLFSSYEKLPVIQIDLIPARLC